MKYTIVVAEKMHKKEELGVLNWPGWDKPSLIEQVQMRIDTGWAPLEVCLMVNTRRFQTRSGYSQ